MGDTTILNMIQNAFANAALSAPPTAEEKQCIDTEQTAKAACESAFTDHTNTTQQATHTQCIQTAEAQLAKCKAALAPKADPAPAEPVDLPSMKPEPKDEDLLFPDFGDIKNVTQATVDELDKNIQARWGGQMPADVKTALEALQAKVKAGGPVEGDVLNLQLAIINGAEAGNKLMLDALLKDLKPEGVNEVFAKLRRAITTQMDGFANASAVVNITTTGDAGSLLAVLRSYATTTGPDQVNAGGVLAQMLAKVAREAKVPGPAIDTSSATINGNVRFVKDQIDQSFWRRVRNPDGTYSTSAVAALTPDQLGAIVKEAWQLLDRRIDKKHWQLTGARRGALRAAVVGYVKAVKASVAGGGSWADNVNTIDNNPILAAMINAFNYGEARNGDVDALRRIGDDKLRTEAAVAMVTHGIERKAVVGDHASDAELMQKIYDESVAAISDDDLAAKNLDRTKLPAFDKFKAGADIDLAFVQLLTPQLKAWVVKAPPKYWSVEAASEWVGYDYDIDTNGDAKVDDEDDNNFVVAGAKITGKYPMTSWFDLGGTFAFGYLAQNYRYPQDGFAPHLSPDKPAIGFAIGQLSVDLSFLQGALTVQSGILSDVGESIGTGGGVSVAGKYAIEWGDKVKDKSEHSVTFAPSLLVMKEIDQGTLTNWDQTRVTVIPRLAVTMSAWSGKLVFGLTYDFGSQMEYTGADDQVQAANKVHIVGTKLASKGDAWDVAVKYQYRSDSTPVAKDGHKVSGQAIFTVPSVPWLHFGGVWQYARNIVPDGVVYIDNLNGNFSEDKRGDAWFARSKVAFDLPGGFSLYGLLGYGADSQQVGDRDSIGGEGVQGGLGAAFEY